MLDSHVLVVLVSIDGFLNNLTVTITDSQRKSSIR
jgi:hypothetical protein